MARNLFMCGKSALTLGQCSDCGELESAVEQLKEDMRQAQSDITDLENMIGNIDTIQLEVVEELPQVGESNTIYLVPKQDASQADAKDEYIWVNNTWEKIGSTDIDLSNYVDYQTYNTKIEELQEEIDARLWQSEYVRWENPAHGVITAGNVDDVTLYSNNNGLSLIFGTVSIEWVSEPMGINPVNPVPLTAIIAPLSGLSHVEFAQQDCTNHSDIGSYGISHDVIPIHAMMNNDDLVLELEPNNLDNDTEYWVKVSLSICPIRSI